MKRAGRSCDHPALGLYGWLVSAVSVVVRIATLLLAHAHREDRFSDGNQPADEADDQHGRERNEHHVGSSSRDEIDPLVELLQGQRDQRCHQ